MCVCVCVCVCVFMQVFNDNFDKSNFHIAEEWNRANVMNWRMQYWNDVAPMAQ